jgi:predicted nucleic acid-binding Zn ribbon protein
MERKVDSWADDDDEAEQLPCPACGGWVYEETEKCPHCGDWIDPRSRAAKSKAWVWITATLLVIVLILLTVRGL